MKNFYFNSNSKYKMPELIINWLLSFLLVALIIFLSLLIWSLTDIGSDYYKETTKVNGDVIKEGDMKSIGLTLFFVMILFVNVIMFGLVLGSKLEFSSKRKIIIKQETFKDEYSEKDLLSLDKKKAISIAKDLKLQRLVSKKLKIEELPLQILIKRILRNIYPNNIKIIRDKKETYGNSNIKTKIC